VLTLAAARLGLILVPLNPRQAAPEIEYAVNDCGPCLVVADEECEVNIPPRSALLSVRAIFVVGQSHERNESYESLLADDIPSSPASIHEEHAFCILYTSGTTGKPKGAVLTHLGIVHSMLHYQLAMSLRPGEVTLLAVPASHVTGLVALILTTIMVGGSLVIMRAFKARDFIRLAARERMTYTLMVPAMYNLCLLDEDLGKFDLSTWRIGGFGGAPMFEATITQLSARLPRLKLFNVYGATETTSPVTVLPLDDNGHRADSVGAALPCVDLKIVDERGEQVAAGSTGELWIGGPMVVPGYWGNPSASSEAFVSGFWRSGDIVSLDPDGFLRVLDRKKDVINRGGYKIYCVEVENVLSEHEEVIECAVVGRADSVLGERVHAFVVTRGGTTSPDRLRQYCLQRLSDYKVPEYFTLRTSPLPRNANGKILKAALRKLLEDDPRWIGGPDRSLSS
jgi:acyl-CoA synthetase (AMP-forming)/AMP-acid ligase II